MRFDGEEYLTAGEIVAIAERVCGVSNSEMQDDDIRVVVRWIGQHIPKGRQMERDKIDIMLFVTIMEFPEYYKRYGLSQFN